MARALAKEYRVTTDEAAQLEFMSILFEMRADINSLGSTLSQESVRSGILAGIDRLETALGLYPSTPASPDVQGCDNMPVRQRQLEGRMRQRRERKAAKG